MKKLFAFFLVLAMIVPMCLISGAAETTEIKPFLGVSWAGDTSKFDNMTNFVTMHIGKEGLDIYPYAYLKGGRVTGVKKIAAGVKAAMDERPDGLKILQIQQAVVALSVKAEAVIFMDHGVAQLKKIATNFFKEYKEIGGELDYLVQDVEYFNVLSYYLYARVQMAGYEGNVWWDIYNHPRYQTEIRPLLVERGFKFYEKAGELYPEIYSIHPSSGAEYEVSRAIWDQVMRSRIAQFITEAFYEPLQEYFPGVSLCDYQVSDTKGWQKTLSRGGSDIYLGGNMQKAGNTSNLNSYFIAPISTFFTSGSYKTPAGYNKTVYEDTSYNMFLWDMNRFKKAYEATDTKLFNVWLGPFKKASWDGYEARKGSTCNTPYYSETVLHTGMLNPEIFLCFDAKEGQADMPKEEYHEQTIVYSELFSELTRVLGAADRKPIYTGINYNDGYVLSGMYAGGRNVWRITPDTYNGTTLESFKVAGTTDPTFSINGKTITFPSGKIIEDGKISYIGTCGYWIETPVDVTPVVTTDYDRYANNPSYIESYEQYQVGSTYQYMDIKPATVWEFDLTADETRPTIVEHNGSNALAITGTSSLLNVKMAERVTAGDYFAKHQGWEVTVTLPATMGADENVYVLASSTDDWIECDGGIKVEGGSVYYDDNGEYKLLEGVSVSAGQTYTFKRIVHLGDAEALTSDFFVYDADGKELGKVEGAAMLDMGIPVGGIKIGCENVTGQVIFDNYKLYPVGLTTDFEIYQADVGIQFTEVDTPKDEATAYRLSWLNGTDTATEATVVAAFYENGALVEEVVVETLTLDAFNDGVVTGVVEVKEGQSVKVYLQTALGDKKPITNNNNGVGNNSGNGGISIARILPIALITLMICGFGVFAAVTFIPVGTPTKKTKK